MGYIDQLLGRNEQIEFVARQHLVVLLLRIFGSLFTFLVFLTLGLVVRTGVQDTLRVIGIAVLVTMILPVYQIVMPILRGHRRGELFRAIWQPALIFVFMLIVGLALLLTIDAQSAISSIALIISIFPLVNTVRVYLDWFNERYVVTNRRVMLIQGVINKRVSDSALEKVNDVVLVQSIIGRMLGYGDVEIITGSDIGVNFFKRIARPVYFKREMLNQKELMHESEDDEPQDTKDTMELIKKLDELRQQGILTDEEFESKKEQLLDQI